MKTNSKFVLMSLIALMSISSMASSNNRSFSTSISLDREVSAKAIGYALLAPVAGMMLGCQRRTLHDMENTVVAQLSSEQLKTFKNMYTEEKMDTKPYTTATGPLSVLMLAGAFSMNPLGLFVAGTAFLGNTACLFVAERSQQYNNNRYRQALNAVNLEKGLGKEGQITGDKGLSQMQKLFCLATRH